MALVQIIYISRSTTAPGRPENGLDPLVARILAKSRSNNRKNGLVGVLYFGNGCFFQCLEGEEGAIDTLYAKLEQDERHKDLKIISRQSISAQTFKDWTMKYVPVEQDMTALLQANGMQVFDPYQFDYAMTHRVINLLLRATEPAQIAAPAIKAPPVPVAAPLPTHGKSNAGMFALAAAACIATAGLLFAIL